MLPYHPHDVDQINRLERRFRHHFERSLEEERATSPVGIPGKEIRVAEPFFTPSIDCANRLSRYKGNDKIQEFYTAKGNLPSSTRSNG